MNAFNTRGPSIFIVDSHFNGRNSGIAERAKANGIGMGAIPSRATINTVKTRPADKSRRIRKGTI